MCYYNNTLLRRVSTQTHCHSCFKHHENERRHDWYIYYHVVLIYFVLDQCKEFCKKLWKFTGGGFHYEEIPKLIDYFDDVEAILTGDALWVCQGA